MFYESPTISNNIVFFSYFQRVFNHFVFHFASTDRHIAQHLHVILVYCFFVGFVLFIIVVVLMDGNGSIFFVLYGRFRSLKCELWNKMHREAFVRFMLHFQFPKANTVFVLCVFCINAHLLWFGNSLKIIYFVSVSLLVIHFCWCHLFRNFVSSFPLFSSLVFRHFLCFLNYWSIIDRLDGFLYLLPFKMVILRIWHYAFRFV